MLQRHDISKAAFDAVAGDTEHTEARQVHSLAASLFAKVAIAACGNSSNMSALQMLCSYVQAFSEAFQVRRWCTNL